MNQENYEFLTENVFPKIGFKDDGINKMLKDKMETGADEISFKILNQNKTEFEFKLALTEDRYYLNAIKATLPDKDGVAVSQEFKLFFQRGYSEVQMENLLGGRSVYTNIRKDGNLYQYWTKLDLRRQKEDGNHREVREYNNSGKFNLIRELSKIPMGSLSQDLKESVVQSLQNGNQESVLLNIKGTKEKAFIEASPHDGKITIIDSKGKEIFLQKKRRKQDSSIAG